MSTQDIPPTEPAKPAPKRKRKRNRSKPKAQAFMAPIPTFEPGMTDDQQGQPKGTALSPEFGKHKKAIFNGRWFWIGSLPTLLGIEGVTIAGLSFNRHIGTYENDINGKTEWTKWWGETIELNEEKVAKIIERLQHTVVRWRVQKAGTIQTEDGELEDFGTPAKPGRKAQLIRIPTDQQMEEGKRYSRTPQVYVQEEGDEAISKYVYCVPCTGYGDRGFSPPPSLWETGLTWPKD